MGAVAEELLATIDQLVAQADQLTEGEQRQQLREQIAALNVAITPKPDVPVRLWHLAPVRSRDSNRHSPD